MSKLGLFVVAFVLAIGGCSLVAEAFYGTIYNLGFSQPYDWWHHVAPFNSGCPSVCPTVHMPWCATNGLTYMNLCELRRASCMASSNWMLAPLHPGCCMAMAPVASASAASASASG